jgi:ribosomal protein L28
MANYNKNELDLLLTKGDSIPKDVAKKLSENKAKCPDNSNHLHHQFKKWYGMLQICFGKNVLITKEARAWSNPVDQYELSYDARFKTETNFGAKVLGLINLTFFQLGNSCLKANSFEDVLFGAISLENDRYGITRNTFQANIQHIWFYYKKGNQIQMLKIVMRKQRKSV